MIFLVMTATPGSDKVTPICILVGNSDFGFQFLGQLESGILLPSLEFRKFPAENKSENLKTVQVENRNPGSDFGIPLITYIGT